MSAISTKSSTDTLPNTRRPQAALPLAQYDIQFDHIQPLPLFSPSPCALKVSSNSMDPTSLHLQTEMEQFSTSV